MSRSVTNATNRYPPYAFRLWHGMGVAAWFGMLGRNGLRIAARRIPRVIEICLYSALNSMLSVTQRLVYDRHIEKVTIGKSPIFIIGHWRAGTTMLHELLLLDERFTAPTTYECFAPGHFLISWRLVKHLTFLLPEKRPMDDVKLGWDRPQEDEFALLNLGAPSFYEAIAFPNHRPERVKSINVEELTAAERNAWTSKFLRFLKQVTCRSQLFQKRKFGKRAEAQRLVLKSPTHTARIATILKLFPDAKFIHIVRQPYELFASTVRLWKTLARFHGLQVPQWDEHTLAGRPSVEDFVLDTFSLMYGAFFKDRSLLAPQQLCEIRYEDLVQNPKDILSKIYEQLALGTSPAHCSAQLEAFSQYKAVRELPSAADRIKITQRWSSYTKEYGYNRAG